MDKTNWEKGNRIKTVWFGCLHIDTGELPVGVAMFETKERAEVWLSSACGWNFEASIEEVQLTEQDFKRNANGNNPNSWSKYRQ